MESDLNIKTVSVEEAAGNIYKDINELTLQNIEAGTLPFLRDMNTENPLPQDMNMATEGGHFGDINKILLELKAAKTGAKSLKWISGANAGVLGLELKDGKNNDSKPIMAFANLRRNSSDELDAQGVYLLDQFTEESLKRVYDTKEIENTVLLDGSDGAKKKKSIIFANAIDLACRGIDGQNVDAN